MKVHSFVRENIQRCVQHKLELACQGVGFLQNDLICSFLVRLKYATHLSYDETISLSLVCPYIYLP
jgi:hypothetical protein